METIMIKTENENIVIYLDKTNIYGYKFKNDNIVEYIDNSIFKYFDFFKCSSNYSIIDSASEYEVRLDNETGFKHYFKNDIDDIKMFYLNNGEDALLYANDNYKNETVLAKKFRLKELRNDIIFMTMWAIEILYYYHNVLDNLKIIDRMLAVNHVPLKYVESISVDDLKEKIYSSNLTDDEKNIYIMRFFLMMFCHMSIERNG